MPALTQEAPSTPTSYPRSPAFVTTHIVQQAATVQQPTLELAGSSQVSSATVQLTQSSAQPSARQLIEPNISNCTPSEQAVIQALQAVCQLSRVQGLCGDCKSGPGASTVAPERCQPERCHPECCRPYLMRSHGARGPRLMSSAARQAVTTAHQSSSSG